MNHPIVKAFSATLVFLTCACTYSIAAANEKNKVNSDGILNQCEYPQLGTNLVDPKKFGSKNTSVCVDIPVELKQSKIVFNMDTPAADKEGNANGLSHMILMGIVRKQQIKEGLIKPEDVSIIGIIHGAALKWATKETNQQKLINEIFKLKSEGINIQLEVCANAVSGAGLTKKDLYSYTADGKPDPKAGGRIYVNQGAFDREIYLQNHGYAYVEEGNNITGK